MMFTFNSYFITTIKLIYYTNLDLTLVVVILIIKKFFSKLLKILMLKNQPPAP